MRSLDLEDLYYLSTQFYLSACGRSEFFGTHEAFYRGGCTGEDYLFVPAFLTFYSVKISCHLYSPFDLELCSSRLVLRFPGFTTFLACELKVMLAGYRIGFSSCEV